MRTGHRGNEGGERRRWEDRFPSSAPRTGVPPICGTAGGEPRRVLPVPQHSPRAQPTALEPDFLRPIPALLPTPQSLSCALCKMEGVTVKPGSQAYREDSDITNSPCEHLTECLSHSRHPTNVQGRVSTRQITPQLACHGA